MAGPCRRAASVQGTSLLLGSALWVSQKSQPTQSQAEAGVRTHKLSQIPRGEGEGIREK